jgi:hypothetical protein
LVSARVDSCEMRPSDICGNAIAHDQRHSKSAARKLKALGTALPTVFARLVVMLAEWTLTLRSEPVRDSCTERLRGHHSITKGT